MSELPAGQVELNGRPYMVDAKGAALPVEMVKEQHKVQDQMVRQLFGHADQLSVAIAAFKGQAFADVEALQDLLAEKYNAKVGGEKGNVTLFSYDGLLKINLQVADLIKFGPELQQAKALVDECIGEWSESSRAEIRALVVNAFNVDKEGQVNRAALLGLRRLESQDPRWLRAMEAIADSQLVVGAKPYIRFSRRASLDAPWMNVSLNIATAAAATPPVA